MGVVLRVTGAGDHERPEAVRGVRLMRLLVGVLTMVRHAMRQPLTRMGDGGNGDQATGHELPGQEWGAHGQRI